MAAVPTSHLHSSECLETLLGLDPTQFGHLFRFGLTRFGPWSRPYLVDLSRFGPRAKSGPLLGLDSTWLDLYLLWYEENVILKSEGQKRSGYYYARADSVIRASSG